MHAHSNPDPFRAGIKHQVSASALCIFPDQGFRVDRGKVGGLAVANPMDLVFGFRPNTKLGRWSKAVLESFVG